jgi:hypothetical protein
MVAPNPDSDVLPDSGLLLFGIAVPQLMRIPFIA